MSSGANTKHMPPSWLKNRWLVGAALAAILAFNLLGGLYWIQQNIVFIGHDASKYMKATLEYAQFLAKDGPAQALFKAFTYDSYRPPALFIAVQPFFWLFGVGPDSAQLVNIVLLAAVILLTFFIGKQVASPGIGLFAALLVGLLPMMMAMSRLLYTEMFLTAAVAVNLLALYKSRQFADRPWTLIWGASLGVGLLVKWTMPIYIGLPLLWFLWKADWLRMQRDALRHVHVDVRSAVFAVTTAVAISWLWYWPDRSAAQHYPLGDWLLWAWAAILAIMLYVLWRPANPSTNWWSAVLVAVAIASLWYLPYSDFGARLLVTDSIRGQEAANPLSTGNALRYLDYFYTVHWGRLAFWTVIPLALLPWIWALLKRRAINALASPLWLSILSGVLVLAVLSQANARNLVPLLPSTVLLATIGLQQYTKPLRIGIGVVWVAVLLLQWCLFTFDGLFDLYQRTQALWVPQGYVVQPASGLTDRRYWIGPTVLRAITDNSGDPQTLAMLVNSDQIHRGVLRNLITLENLDVKINDMTESNADVWFNLLVSKWVLLKDGDNRDMEAPGQAMVQRILKGDPLFDHLYQKVQTYSLPKDETAYLYRRTKGPGYPQTQPALLEQTRAVAEAIRAAWSPHGSLIYADSDLAVWVGLHGLPTERLRVLDEAAAHPDEALSPIYDTLFVVSDVDSAPLLDWLNSHAYHASATGSDFAGLDIYGRPQEPLVDAAVGATWPGLTLSELRSLATVAPGQVLPLELAWDGAIDPRLKVSLRLIGKDGAILASHDHPILPQDRLGLFVPPATAPGSYQVVAVVYDAQTLEPVPDTNNTTNVPIMTVTVAP